jgi:hypothetical protein
MSLALGRPPQLDRGVAWACFTGNLVVPGSGTLIAGKKIGYLQLVLAFVAVALTTVFGFQFISWALAHWDQIHNDTGDDPLANFRAVLQHSRGAMGGIGLFALAWLMALVSSLQIFLAARRNAKGPPRL